MFKPFLEKLEDRTVPTDMYWSPISGTDWSYKSGSNTNWVSEFGGRQADFPATGDRAIFTGASSTTSCTVSSATTVGHLTSSSSYTGTLNINAGLTVSSGYTDTWSSDISFGSSGYLYLGASSTYGSSWAWQGGNMGLISGSHGSIYIDTGGMIIGNTLGGSSGSSVGYLNADIYVGLTPASSSVTGKLDIRSVNGNIRLKNNASINIDVGGTLTFTQNAPGTGECGGLDAVTDTNYSSKINNYGVVDDGTINAGQLYVGIPIINTGIVKVEDSCNMKLDGYVSSNHAYYDLRNTYISGYSGTLEMWDLSTLSFNNWFRQDAGITKRRTGDTAGATISSSVSGSTIDILGGIVATGDASCRLTLTADVVNLNSCTVSSTVSYTSGSWYYTYLIVNAATTSTLVSITESLYDIASSGHTQPVLYLIREMNTNPSGTISWTPSVTGAGNYTWVFGGAVNGGDGHWYLQAGPGTGGGD